MRRLKTTIDLAECESISNDALRRLILPSLKECGAAYLANHGLDPQLRSQALSACSAIHSVPDSLKRSYDVSSSTGARGYFSTYGNDVSSSGDQQMLKPQIRTYGSFELGNDSHQRSDIESEILFAQNAWPPVGGAKETIELYIRQMLLLSGRLFRLFERLLALMPGYFSERTLAPVYQLRLMEYRCIELDDDPSSHLSLGMHTDYECFTVQLESSSALEVMTRDASMWLSVEPPPDGLVLLVGDLMEVISDGLIESVLHRVSMNVGVRHTCIFFAGLDPDVEFSRVGSHRFRAGDHLLARTLENFPHLKARCENGEIVGPAGCGQGNPFRRDKLARIKQK